MSFRALPFLLALLLLLSPAIARAAEALTFKDAPRDVREQSVIDMLRATPDSGFNPALPFSIADYDLNNDGVDEWIVRQQTTPSCIATANCGFFIAGLSKKGLLILGQITAGKIMVDSDRLYGIRKLFVYRNANDDFDFSIYSWNPDKYSFQPIM